jgi:hypothetical protein
MAAPDLMFIFPHVDSFGLYTVRTYHHLRYIDMKAAKIYPQEWTRTTSQVFWGEIAPCDHVVQIYENDDAFLALLSGFVSDGIDSGDAAVVIATAAHLEALHLKLESQGYSTASMISAGQYIPIDAEQMLSRFMVYDWPDENLFNQTVGKIIDKANADGREVRAFGEMVALLWAKGQVGATVRLEHLWNKFCQKQAFRLFCAYPKRGFTQDATESLMHICSAHSKMIAGTVPAGKSEVFYRSIEAE